MKIVSVHNPAQSLINSSYTEGIRLREAFLRIIIIWHMPRTVKSSFCMDSAPAPFYPIHLLHNIIQFPNLFLFLLFISSGIKGEK